LSRRPCILSVALRSHEPGSGRLTRHLMQQPHRPHLSALMPKFWRAE
jgi:hypothetical protein